MRFDASLDQELRPSAFAYLRSLLIESAGQDGTLGAVIADRIVCVDCGGWCHRLTHWPEDDPPLPGDTVAYRCSDCGDRWDLVLDQEDFDD